MGQVFLSHATEDAAIARQVADALRGAGVSVWIAPDSIQPGRAYNEAIVAGLRASDTLAVLVSAASNVSKHVAREVGLADTQGKRIVPIRIEAVEPSDGLTYYLSLPQWVEWHMHGAAALGPLVAMLGGAAPDVAPEPVVVRTPPVATGGVATIKIRRGNVIAYRARKFAILVDGQKVAEIGNDATIDVSVQAGRREVVCRVDYIKSQPFAVDVGAGQTAVLQLEAAELKDIGGQISGLLGSSGYFRWTRIS